MRKSLLFPFLFLMGCGILPTKGGDFVSVHVACAADEASATAKVKSGGKDLFCSPDKSSHILTCAAPPTDRPIVCVGSGNSTSTILENPQDQFRFQGVRFPDGIKWAPPILVKDDMGVETEVSRPVLTWVQ